MVMMMVIIIIANITITIITFRMVWGGGSGEVRLSNQLHKEFFLLLVSIVITTILTPSMLYEEVKVNVMSTLVVRKVGSNESSIVIVDVFFFFYFVRLWNQQY